MTYWNPLIYSFSYSSILTRCLLSLSLTLYMFRSSLLAFGLLWPQVWIGWICHLQDSIASLLFGHYGGHSLWRGSAGCCEYFGSGFVSQGRMLHASNRSHATILRMHTTVWDIYIYTYWVEASSMLWGGYMEDDAVYYMYGQKPAFSETQSPWQDVDVMEQQESKYIDE